MTSANGTLLGLAKQVAKGTPNVTDASFTYLLFNQGGVSPNNVVVPLDEEVGGGAMLRDMKKMGVYSGGGIEFIPRPASLGHFLLGALGKDTPTAAGAAYKHVFSLPDDQFAAPYFTMRSAPGGMWGEQLQDTRVSALALTWRGANFLRGTAAFMGGLPTPVASMATWNALAAVDAGPQFISPVSAIELPTGTSAKALAGSFAAGMNIPLDQQWVVGSYSPDAMDITNRTFVLVPDPQDQRRDALQEDVVRPGGRRGLGGIPDARGQLQALVRLGHRSRRGRTLFPDDCRQRPDRRRR